MCGWHVLKVSNRRQQLSDGSCQALAVWLAVNRTNAQSVAHCRIHHNSVHFVHVLVRRVWIEQATLYITQANSGNQRQDVDWVSLVWNVVGRDRVRLVTAKLEALFDDVTVKAKEDDIAVVAPEDVIIALSHAATKGLEPLKSLT